MLLQSGCWPLLPRPFQCHAAGQNECVARACVRNLAEFGTAVVENASDGGRSPSGRRLRFPHISLLTTALRVATAASRCFQISAANVLLGSAICFSHLPAEPRRRQSRLLASRLRSTSAAGVIMRSGSGGTNWCPPVCPLAPLILVPVTAQREQRAVQ